MPVLNEADAIYVGSDAVDKIYLGADEVWSAAGPAFDPRTQVTALHAMWAEDPDWTNPGDGNAVTSWRNHSGGGDPASSGTNRPTYRASVAALGGKPALEFVAASSQYLDVSISTVAQSFKILAVVKPDLLSGNPVVFGAGGSTSNGTRIITTGPTWRLIYTTALNGGVPTTSGHVLRATVNGGSSQLWVDEVSAMSGNAGTTGLPRLTIAAGSTATPTFANYFDGFVAFYAVYAGATSDVDLAALAADLADHYGL